MKLKCPKCQHVWETKKDRIPALCPYCKRSFYFVSNKPIIIKK